jgi:hypothetical protein
MINQTATSYKVKLGQNWDAGKRNKIRDLLAQRGTATDMETLKQMEIFGLF